MAGGSRRNGDVLPLEPSSAGVRGADVDHFQAASASAASRTTRCVGRAEQSDAAGAALGPGGRDYDEVHRVGGKASTQRTPEQTDIARLWITLGVPAWNPIARQLSSAKGRVVPHNARPFALFLSLIHI